MRLSWNEMRARAADFSRGWAGAASERAEAQTFWNELFAVFGVRRRRVASFEHHVERFSGGRGRADLLWPGVLLVEHKSAGASLDEGMRQALEYFAGLPPEVAPRRVLVSDFRRLRLLDLEAGEGEEREVEFPLSELPERIELFAFMLGLETHRFEERAPVDIEASESIARIHAALVERGYGREELGPLLVRLVFCLFGDDTGVFGRRGAFERYLRERTPEDGRDLGARLLEWFQALDTPRPRRPADIDEDFAGLPYVNGGLFRGPLRIPPFDRETRRLLLEACSSDWSRISPAVFGSLFQSVMDPEARRAEGAHYTSERNILKVVRPLLLDDLRAELARLKEGRGNGRRGRLESFRRRLAGLTFLDPACGCGNFLVVAYRELRRLETEALEALRAEDEGLRLDVREPYLVRVTRFHGIEKEEFPARVAEASLWMMEHLMNLELGDAFGQAVSRFPLDDGLNIRVGDALETDWGEVLPAEECDFVLGNPPFAGAKWQSRGQRAQVRRVAALGGSGGTLDYVAAWLLKAGGYIREGRGRIGFVATNSVVQGEQVGQLWPLLHERHGLEIAFAHRPFVWTSEARGAAKVHVVVLGLVKRGDAPDSARLFSYNGNGGGGGSGNGAHESRHARVTPYLTDGSALADHRLVVREASRPLNGLPEMEMGSQPIDGGRYIFDAEGRRELLRAEPGARRFLRPYVGARELLQGERRWILALQKARPEEIRALPAVRERVAEVRMSRAASRAAPTRALAETPLQYNKNVVPTAPFLAVPEVSSERRDLLPVAWLRPPAVPSNKLKIVLDADGPLFGLLSSSMHLAWLRHVGGRLKSDYSYSSGVVYNTFPVPPEWERKKARLEAPAAAVLAARAAHRRSTLADLYDPDSMPTDLRRAHRALDRAVDRMYRPKNGFASERARVEHLLSLYEGMSSPVVAASGNGAPKRAAKSRRRAKGAA